MEQVLISKKNITVTHYPEKGYLYLNWTGFQKEEFIYESGNEILEIFKKLDCSKVINDNREVIGPWNKASEWTQTYWFPQMLDAGLKQFAWIFSDSIFVEISAQEAMPDSDLIRKFKTYEEAESWLINSPETEVV